MSNYQLDQNESNNVFYRLIRYINNKKVKI